MAEWRRKPEKHVNSLTDHADDLQPAKGDALGMTDKTNKAEVQ